MNKKYRNMLLLDVYLVVKSIGLVAFVVEEAHCVKTWGDDFRKTLAEIGQMRILHCKNRVVTVTTKCGDGHYLS